MNRNLLHRANPYQTPSTDASVLRGRRPVRALVIAGCTLAATALMVALPGAYLFNQEARLFPVNTFIEDIRIGEVTLTSTAVIALSGTLCFCLWSVAAGLWGMARRNHYLNQQRRD